MRTNVDDQRDVKLEQQLQSLLRASEHTLDNSQEAALERVRRRAFLAETRPHRKLWPAMTAACASLLLAAVVIAPQVLSPGSGNSAATEEISSSGEAELYQDLEFYQWLAESELAGDYRR